MPTTFQDLKRAFKYKVSKKELLINMVLMEKVIQTKRFLKIKSEEYEGLKREIVTLRLEAREWNFIKESVNQDKSEFDIKI